MTDDPWSRRRVLRKPVMTAVSVLTMAVMGTLCLAGVLTAPTDVAMIFLAGLAFAVVAIWRLSVLGVVMDHSGVTVRNVFRNIQLDWSQIVTAERPRGYGLRELGVRLVLADGRVIRCTGLQPGNLEPLSASDRFVDILTEALEEHLR
jgi:Bacterial PH domain